MICCFLFFFLSLTFCFFFFCYPFFLIILSVEKELRKTNKLAPIIHTTQCDVDIAKIINVGAFDLDQVLEMDPEFLDPDAEHQHGKPISILNM